MSESLVRVVFYFQEYSNNIRLYKKALSEYKLTKNRAIERARKGGGPTLLECKTYRYYDHVGVRGMGLNYRTDEEVEEWKNKDAIEAFEKRLVQLGVMTKKKIENVHNAINKDIEEAIAFANDSPYPLPEELLENVYNEEA